MAFGKMIAFLLKPPTGSVYQISFFLYGCTYGEDKKTASSFWTKQERAMLQNQLGVFNEHFG
jgi:hypothetical protein